MPDKRKLPVPRGKVDARELIARLGQQGRDLQERELIAPLLFGGRIRTRLNGLVYEFRVRQRFVGWGRFRPTGESEARLIEEALPWERGSYLELFPALRMLLLWPDSSGRFPGTWWAIPYNEDDARRRFGLAMEPLPVFLCDPMAGAERFERVIVRVDGGIRWFEGTDLRADPRHAEWLRDASAMESDEPLEKLLPGLASSERLSLLLWRIHQMELSGNAQGGGMRPPQQRREQRDWLVGQTRQRALEQRLRHALSKADATLHSYSEVAASDGSLRHLVVEWSEHGQTRRYRSLVDPGLNVVSSGICLSGQDRDFDLTSLVNVMAASPSWAGYDDEEDM
ncbi:hypothetical protein KDH_78110 [Dictyobacter sp. S3.2.2.5]|uniref:DUF4132 domain-containing protein n=1 Tax=Dictyobacter halimunensis TaxID=3026934 RepID=A0ABQ6G8N2_9CHLR|nr:hypothetical protein KDH_78110 [Dictyobacter sp. S3.2.2.5]